MRWGLFQHSHSLYPWSNGTGQVCVSGIKLTGLSGQWSEGYLRLTGLPGQDPGTSDLCPSSVPQAKHKKAGMSNVYSRSGHGVWTPELHSSPYKGMKSSG